MNLVSTGGWLRDRFRIAARRRCADRAGASSTVITTPVGPRPTVNGLAMTVASNWAEGRGYRPYEVTVTCTPPSPVDRSINIELSVGPWPRRPGMTVAASIEIPAGSTSVTKTITVPQFSHLQFISMDVWEDGAVDQRLVVRRSFDRRLGV